MKEKIDWLDVLDWNLEQSDDLRHVGYAYIRQGKYDMALPFYEALTVLERGNAYDVQTLGALYLQMNKAKQALPVLMQALMLDPAHLPTRLNQAKAMLELGKREEGLQIARSLCLHKEQQIAKPARALLIAYS